MPRASGSRTGTKHKKRKQVRFAIGDSQSSSSTGLQAAAASAEAAMQALAQEERASLFSLLDVQLQAVEDDELPRRPMRRLEHFLVLCAIHARAVMCEHVKIRSV